MALSGGGARGAAHVGVLRGLEELGIPIDCLAGTSMGAVVGGLYASGMPLAAVETMLLERDWGALFADRVSYRDLAFRRKQTQRRYRFGVRLGLSRGGIRLPTGLSAGHQLGLVLETQLIDAPRDFDQLPVPFRSVATDIVTGEKVVLGSGSLAHAIRASATIPGVLAPLEIEGRLLVDGGLVDNLPVDVVRAMGADVVIAVDISEPLYRRDQINSLVAITWQVVGIQTRGNMTAQLAAADVVLVPDLEGFTSSSFDQIAEMVERGDAVVEAEAELLRPWVVETGGATVPTRTANTSAGAAIETIDSLLFEGLERIDERRLANRVRSIPGSRLDPNRLRDDASSLFAFDRFERVGVRTEPAASGTAVVFEVAERKETIRLLGDLFLSADLEGETAFSALVNVTRIDLNARGGEWRTDLWVGEPQGLTSEFFQPVDFAGRYFVAPSVAVTRERQDVYQGDNKLAEYEVDRRVVALDIGRQWGRYGQLRVGWLRGQVEAVDAVGVSGLTARDDALGGAHATLQVDTTDDRAFPRRGLALGVRYFASRLGLGADVSYQRASLEATYFSSLGEDHTVFGGLAGGRRLGEDPLPADAQFDLGGLFSLGGYPAERFRGDAFGVARLGYLRQLASLPPGLGGRVVGGVVAEWGMAWARPDDVRVGDLRLGLTAFLGADTLLGPILLGYGRAEDGSDRFYVALGQGIR